MGGQSCHYFVTSLTCHMFSNFGVSLSLVWHVFIVTRVSQSQVCHGYIVTKMSLSLPCHIFSNSGVSLSHVPPVTWLSLVYHDQFVTVRTSLLVSSILSWNLNFLAKSNIKHSKCYVESMFNIEFFLIYTCVLQSSTLC